MARYFFNIYNGIQTRDAIGTECETVDDVRAEAVETAQQLVAGKLLANGDTFSMTVNVADTLGKTVMIVSVGASVETVQGSSLAA